MARNRAHSAPPEAKEYSIVPLGATVCAGCSGRPETHAWAEYDDKKPRHDICQQCWTAYCKGIAPREPQAKAVVAAMLKSNEASRDRLAKWRRQLEDRGVISPAIGAEATPNSVKRTVTIGMEWVEERKIHTIDKLKADYPNLDWDKKPPCSVCTLLDHSKHKQKVVVTEMPNSEPKLLVYCKTEVQMDEHFLTPETMLRPGQGDEFFRKQLASMVHLVPFSNCESEDALMSNLSAQDEQNSWNTGPSSTSQRAVDSDPLLHPEDGGVAGLRAAAGAQVSTPGSQSSSAPSVSDCGGGRRLRPQRSNPDATPAKRVRQDTKPGAPASPLQSSQPLRPKVERTRRSRVEASPGAGKLKNQTQCL